MKYTDRTIRCIVNGNKIEHEKSLFYSFSEGMQFVLVDCNKNKDGELFGLNDGKYAIEIERNGNVCADLRFRFCYNIILTSFDDIERDFFIFTDLRSPRLPIEAFKADVAICSHYRDESRFDSSSYRSLIKIPKWIRWIFNA